MENKELEWWKSAAFYHIYVMSFADSNGDGIGDLRGVISRLDYLKWLGIKAIWLSPFYPTPFKDNGYDVKDFSDVDPTFGTMQDFEELLKQCHLRQLKVILDFVPNHTSEEHPWFQESRVDTTNAKRNWYMWQPPNAKGGAPNNWMSLAGGSGWEFDPKTNYYYYHSFLKHQPDLNWRNEQVQATMLDMMRFWLDKGVDGFRVDLMGFLIKDQFLRNNPPNTKHEKDSGGKDTLTPIFSSHHREVNQIIAKMRALVDSYGDKVLLGEVYLSVDELVYYHTNEGAHLPGNFLLVMEDWNASAIFESICNYEAALQDQSWPNWVLSNHDNPRVASKLGREQAKVAALLMLTSRGTPVIYYGEEIGMQDTAIPKSQMKDLAKTARDPCRTPMQWSSAPQAGFSTSRGWLEVAFDYPNYNVEEERKDPNSFLNFYRDLLHLRQQLPTLVSGLFIPVGVEGSVFSYIRKNLQTNEAYLIVCNLSHQAAVFQIPEYFQLKCEILYGTHLDRKGEYLDAEIKVRGNEAFLAKILS